MRERVEVIITGKKYTILGDDNEKHIQSLAEKVDAEIAKLKNLNDELTSEGAAVLAALNFADLYAKSSENEAKLREELAEWINTPKKVVPIHSVKSQKA